MFTTRIALGLLVSALAAAPAVAGEEWRGDYARPGVYLGLGGTVAFPTTVESELEDLLATDVDVSESLGLNLRAGYRFHPYVSTELHFEWLDGFEVSSGPASVDIESWSLTTDGKLFFATGRAQPFASVGIGYAQASLAGFDVDGFVSRFGGGLDFYLTDNIVATVDAAYALPTGDLADFDFVSLGWGLQYRFAPLGGR